MVIEYTNAKTHPSHSFVVTLFVVSAAVFLFIPTTLIVLGYYSSQPTGNLISPLPQGVISEYPTPSPKEDVATQSANQPIIAADNTSTPSSITQSTTGNSKEGSATIPATKTEIKIDNSLVTENSQILVVPQTNDKSIYFVRSKTSGSFIIAADSAISTDRNVDYQIVNP